MLVCYTLDRCRRPFGAFRNPTLNVAGVRSSHKQHGVMWRCSFLPSHLMPAPDPHQAVVLNSSIHVCCTAVVLGANYHVILLIANSCEQLLDVTKVQLVDRKVPEFALVLEDQSNISGSTTTLNDNSGGMLDVCLPSAPPPKASSQFVPPPPHSPATRRVPHGA